MLDWLYRNPLWAAGLGAIVGLIWVDVRARGLDRWARRAAPAVATVLAAAAVAYGIAVTAPDYGLPALLRAVAAGWATAWVIFALLALWRGDWIIGRVLDHMGLALVTACAISLGFIALMVSRAHAPGDDWAYVAAVPMVGALYRLLLLLQYVRLPLDAQEIAGRRIERGLRGDSMASLGAAPRQGERLLFDPFKRRQRGTAGLPRERWWQVWRPAAPAPRAKPSAPGPS